MTTATVAEPLPGPPPSALATAVRSRWGALVALAGALLAGLGGVLPWTDADPADYGTSTVGEVPVLGLRQGLVGGDAWVTVTLAAATAAVAGLMLWRRRTAGSRAALMVLGIVATAWPVASASSLPQGRPIGVGLWLAAIGGLVIVVGAAAARPDPDHTHAAKVATGMRLWNTGRLPDAIAVQQRLLARALRSDGWSREACLHGLILARMHADTANRELCDQIVHTVETYMTRVLDEADLRVAHELRSEIHQTLRAHGVA